MAIPMEFLRSVPYFARLSPEVLDETRRLVFDRKYDRGEIIVLEGEAPEALFFLDSGAVKIFKTSADGKEQILSIVRPGESFNDISVFDGGINPASAQAMGQVHVYGIAKPEVVK